MDTKKITVAVLNAIVKFILAICVVFVIYKCAVGAYSFGYRIFADEPFAQEPGRDVTMTVTEGMSTREIGKALETKGLVEDGTIFYFQNIFSSMKDELAPGVYTLNTSMSAHDMMEIMTQKSEETDEDE